MGQPIDKLNFPAQKARDAQPRTDGPIRSGQAYRHLKKDQKPQEEPPAEPAYAVSITKKEGSEHHSPRPSLEAQKIKARSLLQSGKLSSQEAAVLSQILNDDEQG